MSKDWGYAKLTKTASIFGGPTKLIGHIREKSFKEGQLAERSNKPKYMLAAYALGLLTMAVKDIITGSKDKRDKKRISEEEANKVKKNSVQQTKIVNRDEKD